MPEMESILTPDERILVTGSNGFLGVRVVAELLRRGHRNVRCFVRPSGRREALAAILKNVEPGWRYEVVEGDLTSADDCRRAAEGAAVALHLAAGFDKSVESVLRNSAQATRHLIEACLAQQTFRRFVLVSSFAVYSNATLPRRALLDERCPVDDAPERRHDAYSLGKARQEEIVREYARERGLPAVVLRPGTVFGPGKRELTGRIGLRLSRLFLCIGGDNALPATYVDNCAEAVVLAGWRPGVEGETLNVVDDELPTCREFLRAYAARAGGMVILSAPYWLAYGGCAVLEGVARWVPGFPRRFNRARARAEWKGNTFTNERLRARLDWRPRVPMREAMERFLAQFGDPPSPAPGLSREK